MSSTSNAIPAKLTTSKQLEDLIGNLQSLQCDNNSSVILEHQQCLGPQEDGTLSNAAKCYRAILALVIKCIADQPNLVDDNVKKRLVDQLKKNDIKVTGLVSLDILKLLCSGKESQIMTWIKFESLLTHLIKELIYEPRSLVDEVLALAKIELDPKVAAKLAPILGPCAKICREVNSKHAEEEEFEEKWCEIIEWMGWFISGEDDDL